MPKSKFNACIVGVGFTEYSSDAGRSVLALGAEACQKAIADAGLSTQDVDSVLCCCPGDSVEAEAVATSLNLPETNYALSYGGGGTAPSLMIATAAMAIDTGLAKAAVVYRTMLGRSGRRLGGGATARGQAPRPAAGYGQYTRPYGYLSAGQTMALWCRRHMVKYGTTNEHLGAICIAQRANAVLNPRAQQRKPMTMDDYMAGRWIAEPFRIYDLCLETDGAFAVALTSAERARDCRKKPVHIAAAGYYGEPRRGMDLSNTFPAGEVGDLTANFTGPLFARLYKEAGLGPNDMDLAEIYDCFTYTVLLGLEGLGFCGKGEGGPFAASGAIGRDGSIPVNTTGGMLSEAYIHGMNVVGNAVMQLRGEQGECQIPNAKVAAVTSGAWQQGSGMILTV